MDGYSNELLQLGPSSIPSVFKDRLLAMRTEENSLRDNYPKTHN